MGLFKGHRLCIAFSFCVVPGWARFFVGHLMGAGGGGGHIFPLVSFVHEEWDPFTFALHITNGTKRLAV